MRLVYVPSRRPRYRLLACGVNAGPGAPSLRFAEKDAADVFRHFTSGFGPLRDGDGSLLLGRNATFAAFDGELARLETSTPDFLIVYVSTHGNDRGVLLTDRIYLHERLAQRLRRIGTPSSVVILDTCSAGSFADATTKVGGLLEGILDAAWRKALANATPGNRLIVSTGRGRRAGEGGMVQNGHFTYAFLKALRTTRGDIRHGDTSWISDMKAFSHAKQIMRDRLKTSQLPLAEGLTGDFPFVLSQSEHPIGKATIERAELRRASSTLDVDFVVRGRKYLPTKLRWRMRNFVGDDVFEKVVRVATRDNTAAYTYSLPVPSRALLGDRWNRYMLDLVRSVDVEVVFTLEDQYERAMTERVVSLVYRA